MMDPMRAFSRKSATYADLAALPEELTGELIDGELFASPRPSPQHAVAASVLGADLVDSFHRGRSGPGGWWILHEPELHLEANALVPDLAGWRRERMSELPATAAFELPPDWICEILSPATARLDLVRKLPKYAAAGVPHAWILNPAQQTLEVYRLADARWLLLYAFSGDDRVRAEPFEAVELDLAAVWGKSASAAD